MEMLESVITAFHLLFAAEGIELATPRRTGFSLVRGKEGFPGVSSRGSSRCFRNHARLFSSHLGHSRRIQRAKHRRAADGQGNAGREARRTRSIQPAAGDSTERAQIRIELGGEPVRRVSRSEARAAIARLEREITCETMLLDLDRRSIDLGTAAHEMIHQLAADSGLVPRHDAFPYWLHEGLAAQFEVIRGGRWSGISRAHDLRLPDWRRIQEPMPLERLVRDGGFGRGYQRDAYAHAWALVYYLRTGRPREFLKFLDLLRSPEIGGDADSPPSARGDRAFGAFPASLRWRSDRHGTRLASLHGDGENPTRAESTPGPEEFETGRVAPRTASPDKIDTDRQVAKIVRACISGA